MSETVLGTKLAVLLREDLQVWQKLNVTAFLMSGVVGTEPALLGEPYKDEAGNRYRPLLVHPTIVLAASANRLHRAYLRALDRGLVFSLFIEDMFSTTSDAANRATVAHYQPQAMPVVGLALLGPRKVVDQVTKGVQLHP